MLLQYWPNVLMVTIWHNGIIQRILPCSLIEFLVHISVIAAKNRAKVVVSVIECINKGNSIWTDLRLNEIRTSGKQQPFYSEHRIN